MVITTAEGFWEPTSSTTLPSSVSPIATTWSSYGAFRCCDAIRFSQAYRMLSSFKPCLNACSATMSLFINASNFVQRYFSMPYLRKLSLHSVVSRILQKRKGHPGDGCRPRHSHRLNAQKESLCTGSYDAEILTHAQMFVQSENRTYFRYYRHKRNTRRPCAISRHSPEAEAREHATAKRPPFSRMHKKAASPSKR